MILKFAIKKFGTPAWRTLGAGVVLIGVLAAPGIVVAKKVEADRATIDAGKSVAVLFHSARVVISRNQDLINDAGKGDKGLTGDEVVSQTKKVYADLTGAPLGSGKDQQLLLDAIRAVMDENQETINAQGTGFKGFVPATFGRQVADKVADVSSIKIRQTNSRVRNRKNRADEWEKRVIEMVPKTATGSPPKVFRESFSERGKAVHRFLVPEYYESSCLACHGGPKGERDITGSKMEGRGTGDLGGAISVIYKG